MKGDKNYVQLNKEWRAYYGKDKNGKFFLKVIEASEQKKSEWIEYWVLCYNNAEELQRAKDNLDPDVKKFIWMKEKTFDWWTSIWGMYIDNEAKETYFANLFDNNKPEPQTYSKLVIFTEADYREPKVNPINDPSTDNDGDFWDDTKEERTKARKPF